MNDDNPGASRADVPRRHELLKPWQLILAVAAAHALVTIVLSPGLFVKEDTSPQGLLEKARNVASNGEYEESLQIYQQVLLQKPQIPAVFSETEKEMGGVRLKMLEAQRRARETAKAAEEAEDKTPEGKDSTPAGSRDEAPTSPPPQTPEVSLPVLPDIGGLE